MEGSLLFAIGAAASMFHHLEEWQEKALVTCAYFAGGIAFTVGVSSSSSSSRAAVGSRVAEAPPSCWRVNADCSLPSMRRRISATSR